MHYIAVSILVASVAFPSGFASAALTSDNFSLTHTVVGGAQTVMNSSNFSLTREPVPNLVLGNSEVLTPVVPVLSGQQTGSMGVTSVTELVLEDMPVIISTLQSAIGNTDPVHSKNAVLRPQDLEDNESIDILSNDNNRSAIPVTQLDTDNMVATLIHGDWEGFVSAVQDTFATRGPRVAVLIIVLGLLFVVRTYTQFGRRLSPF